MLVLGGRETIIPSELGRRPAVACRALRALMPNTVPAIALQEAAAAEEKATNTEIDREYQGTDLLIYVTKCAHRSFTHQGQVEGVEKMSYGE